MIDNGKLFIISAPSGAGKTSLVKALVNANSEVVVSISHTTRKKRSGEIDGKDYFFIDVDQFEQMIERDEFIEHAKVFDNYYGTSQSSIEGQLGKGLKVILEIDWQGAAQVRDRIQNVQSIFILPPSKVELEKRLRNRGQDSEEIIARRMRDAEAEISHYNEFDYVLLNDNFDRALSDLTSLVVEGIGSQSISEDNIEALASDLLSKC